MINPAHVKPELRSPAQQGSVLDDQFFRDHPDRSYRIRLPVDDGKQLPEYEREFLSLGDHADDRRRNIVKRVERAKARAWGVKYMPIPFLLFADESVRDDDATLQPIFDTIMKNAASALRPS